MIKFTNGNMFETPADVRINTANCVGVMGAGVALAFKKKFPDMFKEYKKECSQGNVRPGKPHVWTDYQFEGNTIIINFPTKDHWRQPSKYEYIEDGLKWLRSFLQEKGKVSVTLPALGCGHGGLDWGKVKELISNYLKDLDADIFVFEPADTHKLNGDDQGNIAEELDRNGIHKINPSDTEYPKHFKGKSSSPLYVKGDASIINKGGLVILSSTKIEEREKNAISLCLNSLIDSDITFIVGYNAGDRMILRKLIEANRRVVVCIDEGILQFKIKKDIADCWDDSLVTVVSILKPNQKWARHNFRLCSELKIAIGITTLISSEKPTWLTRVHSNIQKLLQNSFYIKYGSAFPEIYNFFSHIGAFPISRDTSGNPKVQQLLERCLHNNESIYSE